MSVDVKALSAGRPVIWSWCGTCTRGGSNKWYAAVVVRNDDGTYDGICAGAAIGSPPRLYPQIQGTDREAALAKVQKQIGTKKKEYDDNPEFLVGLDQPASLIRVPKPEVESNFPVIWPMLIPNSSPESKIEEAFQSDDWVAEQKFDGIRLIGYIHEGGTRWTTRSGSVDDPSHPIDHTDALPHLNIKWPKALWGTALDGELIGEGISSDVSGDVIAKDGRDRSDLVVVVFDLLYLSGRDLTDKGECWSWEDRYRAMHEICQSMRRHWEETHTESCPLRASQAIRGERKKRDLYAYLISQGYEGVVFKNIHGHYIQGKRPSGVWMKLKKHLADDDPSKDVVIVGFTDGKGKFAGQIGAIRFGQWVRESVAQQYKLKEVKANILTHHDGMILVEFGQVSGMKDALRKAMTDDPNAYIGRVMKISAMERFKGGTYRHPQFESLRAPGDKSSLECCWVP